MLRSLLVLLPSLVTGSSVFLDEDGVPVRSKAGRLAEDDLYHWGNGQFEVARYKEEIVKLQNCLPRQWPVFGGNVQFLFETFLGRLLPLGPS